MCDEQARDAVLRAMRKQRQLAAARSPKPGQAGATLSAMQEKTFQTTSNVGQTLANLTGLVQRTMDESQEKDKEAEKTDKDKGQGSTLMQLMEMQMMAQLQRELKGRVTTKEREKGKDRCKRQHRYSSSLGLRRTVTVTCRVAASAKS